MNIDSLYERIKEAIEEEGGTIKRGQIVIETKKTEYTLTLSNNTDYEYSSKKK